MQNIDSLEIYQDALEFSNTIWDIVIKWDYFSQKTIGSQLVRSCDSISANIAEGYGRYHFKENLHFCYYARGSFEETKDWIRKASQRNLLKKQNLEKIDVFINNFSKRLNSYIKYIKKSIPERR